MLTKHGEEGAGPGKGSRRKSYAWPTINMQYLTIHFVKHPKQVRSYKSRSLRYFQTFYIKYACG